jgi:hypothetical protein
MIHYTLGGRRMSLSPWDEGSGSDQVTGLNHISGWLATVKSSPGNRPSYHASGVRGRLRFDRSLPRRGHVPLRRKGLSGEAMKGNPTTTAILRVDESKSSPQTTEDSAEPTKRFSEAGGVRPRTLQ